MAEAAHTFANLTGLETIEGTPGLSPQATGQVLRGSFERATPGLEGSFPILKSKGADAQTRIQSKPDEHWVSKKRSAADTR